MWGFLGCCQYVVSWKQNRPRDVLVGGGAVCGATYCRRGRGQWQEQGQELTLDWHYWCICISQCLSPGHMRAPPEQSSHLHTKSVTQAEHPLEASCSCINTSVFVGASHMNVISVLHCTVRCQVCSSRPAAAHKARMRGLPHGDGVIVSLIRVVCCDGDLLARGQLDRLIRVLEKPCSDFWPLQMPKAVQCNMHQRMFRHASPALHVTGCQIWETSLTS